MAQATAKSIVQQIESLFEGGSITGLTDAQLLQRFIARRDAVGEAVFAALVARHGPMVLHICLQKLGDRHHAEDAFQAVFLILAHKARSIRDPNLLSAWLYGVALRTARKAKIRLGRQGNREEGNGVYGLDPQLLAGATVPSADEPALAREQAEILHDEIDRLPKPFRTAVVLCYFEGLALDEAARRLRWPAGTLRSRLARAREKLRRGLSRRGVVLSAAVLAEALSSRSASASITPRLCNMTTNAAMSFTAVQATRGIVSASVCALAQEVLRAMLYTRLRLIMLILFALAAVATGVGLSSRSFAGRDKPENTVIGPQREVTARPKKMDLTPAPGRMFVVGRVLNPEGKPVPNATVMVSARAKAAGATSSASRLSPTPIGQATADSSGLFRLDAPRTSSSGHEEVGAVALSSGYGAAWVDLDPDAGQPKCDITLRPEQVIQGRLFDVHGRPAGGVEVAVHFMGRVVRRDATTARDVLEGRVLWHVHGEDPPAWPHPATTDAEGRFTLRGVGQGLRVMLRVHDPRFAWQFIPIDTDNIPDPKQVTIALEPAKIIKGRVTYADTAGPVPHARLEVGSQRSEGGGTLFAEFETDDQGRFHVNPRSGDTYFVTAHPPAGQPYLGARRRFEWPKGAVERSLDVALVRGVVIRGKVTEDGSGRPVKQATVRYVPYRSRQEDSDSSVGSPASSTGPDGSFLLGALARPGHLAVEGPSDDYVMQEVGQRMLSDGLPGGSRRYSHAIIALKIEPSDTERVVNVTLHRGMTVKGELVGPDGHPAPEAWMFGRGIIRSLGTFRLWRADYHGIARNGHVELHGLDPDTKVPVYFLDPTRKLGTTYSFAGKSAVNMPVVVHLEPCGAAKARLITLGGQPVVGRQRPGMIMMVVTGGPSFSLATEKAGRILADEGSLIQIDPINYGKGLAADAEGRITLPVLIPGATYRITDVTMARDPAGPQLRKEFTVKSGETLDLGDILIEKPSR